MPVIAVPAILSHGHVDQPFVDEREWRVFGNVQFAPEDVQRLFVSRAYEPTIHQDHGRYGSRVKVLG